MDLSDQAVADLGRSGIDPDDALAAGIYSVDDAREVFPEFEAGPALVLPYYDPFHEDEDGDLALFDFKRDGQREAFARVRYLDPPKPSRTSFKKAKPQRYGQPVRSGVFPYFPLTDVFDWLDIVDDPKQEIVVTEGEKKALAGCLAGIPTVGLGGVYNFMSEGELLEALRLFTWKKRNVYLNFDSDAADNPDIQAAEARLAEQLGLKKGASVYLTRLPHGPDGAKQGIDDVIVNEGEDAWHKYLRASDELRKADSKVIELNEHVCWIESEGKIWEFKSGNLIQKNDFVSGSSYSTRKQTVPNMNGSGVKQVSIPKIWLEHEHALRFAALHFDPSTTEPVVERNGLRCLNLFKGFESKPGPVEPFLELTEHLTRHVPAADRDFLFKLVAYKFQNPAKKIPLCPVIVGAAGSGKSLWAHTLAKAVAPYSQNIASRALLSDFNGFVEESIILTIDEAQSDDLQKGRDFLKHLISEPRVRLNKKFRAEREIDNPGFYILTSNDRAVAAFEHDDRRFYVLDVRTAKPKEFYRKYGEWLEAGGAAHVADYLQNYDLEGWEPPARAPMTAEKANAYRLSLSDTQLIAERMKEAEGEGIILEWMDSAMTWAYQHEADTNSKNSAQATEVRSAIKSMPVRNFYTAHELSLIFPHLAFTLHTARMKQQPAAKLAQELMKVGIFYIQNPDDWRGHKWNGRWDHYYVVADIENTPSEMTQNEFERQMRQCPTYAEKRKLKSY